MRNRAWQSIDRALSRAALTRVLALVVGLGLAMGAGTLRAAEISPEPPVASLAITWEDLKPAATSEEPNPFALLTEPQVALLVDLVRIDRDTARATSPDERQRLRQQRQAQVVQLAAEGLDAEALLQVRTRLMDQRRAQAETPVAAWQGRRVQLTGFLVPASSDGRAIDHYLLVPTAGACSHTAPPPMNQILRIPAPLPQADAGAGQRPFRVSGRLEVSPREQWLRIVDGEQFIRSAYALEQVSLQALPEFARPLRP